MRVLLTGGTGYVGSAVLRRLAPRYDVLALVRDGERAAQVSALGATPLLGDLRDLSTVASAAREAEAIVHLGIVTGDDRTEVDGRCVELFLEAAPRLLLYTSVLFVLGDTAGADEEAIPLPPPYMTRRHAVEERVLDAAGDGRMTAVIRPGMVYGGGNGGAVSELFRGAYEEGEATYVGDGANAWSLVHRDDVAALYDAVLQQRAQGIFHAVDGDPLPTAEVARLASVAAGRNGATAALPLEKARAFLGSFADALCLDQVVTSERSRRIGWRPEYRSFRDSASEAFAEWRNAEHP